jgi:dethiobiotin synthetase
VGWIGNRVDPTLARLEQNLASLERLLGQPPLAVLPHLEDPSPGVVASLLESPRLLQRLATGL